jgi:hypothetical protein
MLLVSANKKENAATLQRYALIVHLRNQVHPNPVPRACNDLDRYALSPSTSKCRTI